MLATSDNFDPAIPRHKLSPQQLVDCVRPPFSTMANGSAWGSLACRGGWPEEALQYALENSLLADAAYPYVGDSAVRAAPQSCNFTAIQARRGPAC